MFCPDGYVPLSAATIDFDEWLSALVRASIDHGDPLSLEGKETKDFNRYCTIRSYGLFLNFIDDCQSTAMCGFDGTILKPHRLFLMESSWLHWDRDWFPQELKAWDNQLLFVNPETFTISLNFWRNIWSGLFKQNLGEDWTYLQVKAEVLTHFEGWALCISEEDDNRMQQYIVEHMHLPIEVLDDVASTGEAGSGSRRGRPALHKAKEAFAALGYDKGDKSWEQMARHLEKLSGQKPSARTMRDWASQAPPRDKQG